MPKVEEIKDKKRKKWSHLRCATASESERGEWKGKVSKNSELISGLWHANWYDEFPPVWKWIRIGRIFANPDTHTRCLRWTEPSHLRIRKRHVVNASVDGCAFETSKLSQVSHCCRLYRVGARWKQCCCWKETSLEGQLDQCFFERSLSTLLAELTSLNFVFKKHYLASRQNIMIDSGWPFDSTSSASESGRFKVIFFYQEGRSFGNVTYFLRGGST